MPGNLDPRSLACSRRSVSGELREKRRANNEGRGVGRKRESASRLSPLAIFPLAVSSCNLEFRAAPH